MRNVTIVGAGTAILLAVGLAVADPLVMDPLDPTARDTYTVRWLGRTLTSPGALSVRVRGAHTTDAAPGDMVLSTALSGTNDVLITLDAAAGCPSPSPTATRTVTVTPTGSPVATHTPTTTPAGPTRTPTITPIPQCRAGNVYELRMQPVEDSGNRPVAVLRLDVRQEVVVP